MKYCEFPVGYPTLLARETFANMEPWTRPEHNTYKGIIFCRVRAPPKLKRPLLPHRTPDGRLVFPLCRKCADERNQRERCDHQEDKDRTWVEGYTHAELNKALSKGYVVTEVYEVHHYEKWAHVKGKGEEAPLFADYINAFLKMKLEASGWPKNCKTDQDKTKFLEQCKRQDGIELDPEELDKGLNPALRQIAVILKITIITNIIMVII